MLEVVRERPVMPSRTDVADRGSGIPSERLGRDWSTDILGELRALERQWRLGQAVSEAGALILVGLGGEEEDVREYLGWEVGDVHIPTRDLRVNKAGTMEVLCNRFRSEEES